MKTLFLSLILLCALSTLHAQSGLTVDSKIEHVTVYRQGAEVTRTATVKLPAGETQLLFKKLPFQLQEESLQLKIDQSVTVVSIAQEVNYLNEEGADSLATALQEEQLALRDSLQALSNRSQVYVRERDLLLANQSLGGNDGVAVEELERAAVLYRNRLLDIEGHLQRIRQQSVGYKKQMVRLGNQLLELNAKSEADPEVIVKVVVNTPKAMSAEVELLYVVPKAGRDPFYNIRVRGYRATADAGLQSQSVSGCRGGLAEYPPDPVHWQSYGEQCETRAKPLLPYLQQLLCAPCPAACSEPWPQSTGERDRSGPGNRRASDWGKCPGRWNGYRNSDRF